MDFGNSKISLKDVSLELEGRSILRNVNLSIEKDKITLIFGKSGSGKTTLLNIMNMLYVPTSGQYFYEKECVDFHNEKMISSLRMKMGYFHQELALLEGITVKENLDIFSEINKCSIEEQQCMQYLKMLDIHQLFLQNISKMSGGERQRVAFVKLLLLPYETVLIDEPTNNLDTQNIWYIMKGIQELKKQGKTVVVVSHHENLKKISDVVIDMEVLNE